VEYNLKWAQICRNYGKYGNYVEKIDAFNSMGSGGKSARAILTS